MNHAADGRDVNEFMKTRPTLPAQPFNPALRRSDGERHEQKETEHADGDEGARVDVCDSALDVEGAVEPDIRRQVQETVEESAPNSEIVED